MPTYALPDELKYRLETAAAEMRSDSFWRDMASPLAAALRALKDEAEAMDSVSAKSYRATAIQEMEKSCSQLKKAAENKLFVPESLAVEEALTLLRSGTPSMATTAPPPPVAPSPPKSTPTAGPAPPAAPTPAFEPPSPAYSWDQDDDGGVVVTIPVPATTQKADVSVVFAATHLKVTVQGHPVTPVLDADLLYATRPSDCSWSLEGSGVKRRLNVSLEKVQAELEWAGLTDDAESRKKSELTAMAQGIEGVKLQQYGQ